MRFHNIILTVFTFGIINSTAVIIESPLGSVRGSIQRSLNDEEFYNFNGIPFAEPPIGELRFKKPIPKKPWEGIFEANKHESCSQASLLASSTKDKVPMGVEDCLVLSVYVPKKSLDEKKFLPVMVWIHGGGFTEGSGNKDFYGPERYMDYGIVVVAINYRLGPFGFLSSGNDDIPGNQGFWDQTEALKWVQKNIAAFGGDANQVTIAGESAGSMSVMSLYVSKQTKGLFHKAIAQSGNINAMPKNSHPKCGVEALAKALKCDLTKSNSEILTCLQEVSSDQLVGATIRPFSPDGMLTDMRYNALYSTPIDDSKFSSNPFFSDDPYKMLQKGEFNDVPLIIGANKDEGDLFTSIGLPPSIKKNFFKHGPAMAVMRPEIPLMNESLEKLKMIVPWYFGSIENPANHPEFDEKFAQIMTDSFFVMPNILMTQILAKTANSPIYHYKYSYSGSFSLCDLLKFDWMKFVGKMVMRFFGSDAFVGNLCCHGDELFLQWKTHGLPIDAAYTVEDKKMSANLLQMWTDFVKTSNPTPSSNQWTRMDSIEPKWFHINTQNLGMEALSSEMSEKWMKLYEKYPPLNFYTMAEKCKDLTDYLIFEKDEL